jgi:hypothetical protein
MIWSDHQPAGPVGGRVHSMAGQTRPRRKQRSLKASATERLYYEAIDFSNVKCFQGEHSVDFRDRAGRPSMWTLFLGENGVGKTSVLQMLAWMRPVEPPEQKKTIEPALFGEPDNFLFLRLVRQAEEAVRMTSRATFARYGVETDRQVHTYIQVVTNSGNPHTGDIKKLADVSVGRAKNSSKPAPRLPLIGYGANRQIGAKNLGDPVLSDPVAMLFSPVTTLYDPESILRDLDYAARMRKAGARARRTQFLELIATIAPAVGAATNIHFTGPSINAAEDDPTGIKFMTGRSLVPFSGMSLGQQTTIAWALDLAWRLVRLYPDSEAPLSEPAIVLVDEIDLHLHPKWQQNLRTYLSQHFPATQFIATAHSPLMAQASLDANLVVFQEKDGRVSIWNDAERLLDWRLDQVVTALFGLPSGRGREVDALLEERDRLLDNRNRTDAEEMRLNDLKARIAGLSSPDPVGDRKAMEIIRRVAARLEQDAV